MQTDSTARAWAFVIANIRTVDRMSWKFASVSPFQVEDFRGNLITRLVETFDKYDPARAGASTWVYMQARKVREAMYRADKHYVGIAFGERREGEADPVGQAPTDPAHRQSAEHAERLCLLSEVVTLADVRQQLTLRARLEGIEGRDATTATGLSRDMREESMTQLRKRLNVTTTRRRAGGATHGTQQART